jgi:hypothetical protein
MNLEPPDQLFATTLYDRHQPQQLSFVFIPTRSMANRFVPELSVLKDLIDPNANFLRTIAPSYLPAALASLLSPPAPSNPFSWADTPPPVGYVFVDPNSIGFAEYVAFSEVVPFEESPLRSKSLMTLAVATGAKIGLIAGGATPFVLLTVPAGIILCTAGVIFGPALGEKVSKLIGV